MADQNTTEQYVPWKKGADLLGISKGSFFYLVESGQVRKRGERHHGLYHLGDIQKVKAARDSGEKRVYRRVRPVDIDWLYPDDILACLQLDKVVYDHMFLAEAAKYQAWVTKNPHIAMAAFDQRDRNICLAYVSILPLPEQVILDILTGKRDELSVRAEEIETYDRPGGYTLLVNSAVTHPDRPDLLFKVLSHLMAAWVDRYPERYITRIFAQSVTPRGDMLIQRFFMSPLYGLANNAYVLDLSRPGSSRVIRRFQQQIEEKAALPDELKRSYELPAPPRVVISRPPAADQPAHKHIARTAHTSTPPAADTVLPSDLPAGSLTLKQLADDLNVTESTVKGHLRNGRYQDTPIFKRQRGDVTEYEHFFTPDQQAEARAYHAAHGKRAS